MLEFQSQKVMLRKLDDDVVDALGRCLVAAARGPFFSDDELSALLGRSRESMQVVAGMWPRMNLAAPDLRELLGRLTTELSQRASEDPDQWEEWVDVPVTRLEAAFEVFRLVSTGEV